MLGTRAAAFAGKISNLRDSILRIQNGTMPQPTCIDLANIMKYFSQVLHDFRDFKDIENVPLYASEKKDCRELLKTLPNFDYSGLYRTLNQVVDVLPLIPQTSTGLDIFGSNLLMLFKCLVPFLDQENVETMPYLVATLFMSLPSSLHKEILDTLCFNLLPFTIDQQQKGFMEPLVQNKRPHLKLRGSRRRYDAANAKLRAAVRDKPAHCIVKIEDSSDQRDDQRRFKKKLDEHTDSLDDQGIGSDTETNEDIDRPEDEGIGDEMEEEGDFAMLSVTSIMMIAFHHITEPMHHSQLVECLMKLKRNIFEDLLFVIAYGTTRARCPAVEILFRYWPDICPSQQDRKNNSHGSKLKHISWLPTKCQNKNCSFTTLGDDEAVKMCLDFKLSISLSGLPPPMLICLDCVDSIYKQQIAEREKSANPNTITSATQSTTLYSPSDNQTFRAMNLDDYSNKFVDLLLPMERVSKLCENKKCRSSSDRTAIGTCFDIECANYNCKKPIRYCKSCLINIHEPSGANNYDVTLQNHIRHSSIDFRIMQDESSINTFIEAIISLLKEAAPADRPSKDSDRYLRSLLGPMSQFNSDPKDMSIATEEKQLISQYGIWLMTGLCKDVDNISDQLLSRLLGMLFQWFHFTACLPDDQAGSALEKLKGECIKGWILDVKNKRLDVFISCLLPHPTDCSKIGGHWEVWPDTAYQIKEGFKRLLCLVPYDIITDDVWDEIMPHWMECFRHEVPENELSELKILLSKVFDPELSPLGFETKQMYNFISSRFEDHTNTENQEQTLYWIQIITMLEIPIPINFLFNMLRTGVKTLAEMRGEELANLAKISEAKSKELAKEESLKKSSSGLSMSSSSSSATKAANQRCRSNSHNTEMGSEMRDKDTGNHASPPQEAPSQPTMGHRERQAAARAAFSARVMQQANLLDQGLVGQKVELPTAAPVATGQPTATSQTATARGVRTIISPTSGVESQTTNAQPSTPSSRERTQSASAAGTRLDKKNGSQASDLPKLKLQPSEQVNDVVAKVDNNLVCYILMLDILLKQLDLQEISAHRGLDSHEAQQAIELLNLIVSTPWVGRHTCCDTLPALNGSSTDGSAPNSAADKQQQPQQHSWSAGKLANDPLGPDEHAATDHNVHLLRHCAQGFEQEDSYESCVFCEVISTFHQLSMLLLEFFAPLIEVSICEVSNEAANGEFNGQPDYSRIGLDHLGPSPKELADEPGPSGSRFNFNTPGKVGGRDSSSPAGATGSVQLSPFSPSYSGPTLKPEALSCLPMELQLSHNLLVQFHQFQTPDIVSQLLQMIKLISLHSQVFSKAAKQQPQFIAWCQHNMLISKLWSLCQLESSEIARTCVPLLLHCVTLPWGVRLFRDLVERDFNSGNWLSRFRAVERVVTIAYFCEPSTIKNSTLLQSTMASAFCFVVRCLDDIEAIVAQRALVSLEMMKTSSLKLLLWCLEVQFDYIIIDRPMILRSVFQLYNHLRDRRFLTWEFFLNRFDTIFLEAQIYLQQTGEIPSFTMQDLKNTNTKSEIYQKKIARAKEALLETHHSRSLSTRFHEKSVDLDLGKSETEKLARASTSKSLNLDMDDDHSMESHDKRCKQSLRMQLKLHQEVEEQQKTTATSGIERRKAQSPIKKILQHGKSTSSRYQSVALLTSQSMVKRTNSKFLANLAMQSVPPMMLPDKLHQHLPNSFVDDGSKLNEIAQENHVFGVVHRICDEDRDTMHSLIFLLMQFFSRPDPSHPQSFKTLTRSHQIVMRHLNILMGFSIARKNFLIPANNLRLLPVFNAFITSLPKVLDFNYSLGSIVLDTALPVLIYCPAPDETQYDLLKPPKYSLWLLNPMMRHSWLMSVMAFLYKYQFGQAHLKDQVQALMWIVINTLESHLHRATLDSTAQNLDRYLVNVRESSASAVDEQPNNSATHSKCDTSPDTASKVRIEADEQQVTEQSPTGRLVNSSSNQSLKSPRHQAVASSSDQGAGPSPLAKSLTKTDTSESLGAKPKAGQRRPLVDLESAPSDERLLPIGLPPTGSKRSEPPAAERLLPIGTMPKATDSSLQIFGQQQTAVASSRRSQPDLKSSRNDDGVQPEVDVSKTLEPRGHETPAPRRPASSEPPESTRTPTPTPKSNKRRFGAGQGTGLSSKQQALLGITGQQQIEATASMSGPTKSSAFSMGNAKKNKAKDKDKDKDRAKEYVYPKQVGGLQPAFSSPSVLSEQLAQVNRHSQVQEFSDKELSMCLVILETFIHHEPSMAAQMLPNILRLVTRYSTSSTDSWQTGSNMHLVGGSVFVARQFIRVSLHDLMENNIFHQIFTSHFTGYEFYKSLALALADFPDLNQLAPLSKLFEDLNKQKNLPRASSLMTILENVATYFECVISESSNQSLTTWTQFITNWENFLRKLILALPRYSGSGLSSSPSATRPDQLIAEPTVAPPIVPAPNSQAFGQQAGGSSQLLGSRFTGDGSAQFASASAIPSSCSMIMSPIMRIILSTTKISHLATCKTIVDPYSKIISYTVLNSQFKYEHLLEINHNCCRLYTRDREKYLIQRTIAYELIQVLKFRFFILEENLLILLLFVLQDVGGTLAPKVIKESLKIDQSTLCQADSYITNISECLRQYIGDLLEFITDVHAISRINDNLIAPQPSSINRDSFGGHVKAAISQCLALEMSLSSGNDNRTLLRYLPWLYTSPSIQQGPREFIDCVSHIRQLSWIILGSLQHSSLARAGGLGSELTSGQLSGGAIFSAGAQQQGAMSSISCQPIPIEKNGNVAEHVQVILAGFAEQSKESVLHMSGLFHAFLLCQLWTMYCENICNQHPPNSERYQFCQSTLDDFWAKITPGVLRLVSHSRVMSEMVSTHFLQLIESLIESNSSVLIRYLPMWNSVFYSDKRRNKSGNLAIRLQKCIEWQPPDLDEQEMRLSNKRFINWLEKVQYKMSHIEIQSSQAAPFYLT